MIQNKFGQPILNLEEATEALLKGFDGKIYIDDIDEFEKFQNAISYFGIDGFVEIQNENQSLEEFDQERQKNWFFPKDEKYSIEFIIQELFDKCNTKEQKNRVEEELQLYYKRDALVILQLSKYLVESFKKNNVIWGVGRGSSVASYCLYLIGIHKIDSLKYNLDINEFLKEE